jgi:hypothetical protein
MVRKVLTPLLLAIQIAFLLLPACARGDITLQTSDTSGDETAVETTAAPETEALYGELAFDEVCADMYEIAGNAWPNFGGRGKLAFAATNRAEFLALYDKTWTNGVDVFETDELLQKARDYFTDEFFKKYTVIVVFSQEGNTDFYTTVDSVVRDAGSLTVTCRRILGFIARIPEPIFCRSNIVIIDKAAYDGEEIKVTNIRIKDEESIQRALLEGWHFEDEALYQNAMLQKRERDLAILEKYRP